MALNDDKKNRDPLQQQYRLARSQYDAATTQAQTLAGQRQKLTAGTMPIVREGRGGSASITGYSGGAPGTSAAVAEIDKRLNAANATRTGLIPTFNNLTSQFRQQIASNQANAALARVGAAPISPPSSPASQAPAVAKPSFADVRSEVRTSFGSPSQRMTDDQANAAEVNARTATQPSSPQTGVGASVGAGGAAPGGIVKSKDKNGNTVYTGTGAYAADTATPATAGTIGSVNRQNFGNPVVPQAQASIAQPRVASTFGMSVTDPRMNDQVAQPQLPTTAATSPPRLQRGVFGSSFWPTAAAGASAEGGSNFSMPVPNGAAYRSADQMAEHYASREDREARQKVLSDLDSQRFRLEMIAGNPGRRGRAALDALGQNAQQQAALIAAGEKLSADAVQGRANRSNVLANTGMEQAGQTQRQQMAGDVASQGQFLDYDAKNRATNASLIERPTMKQAADGSLYSVTGTSAAPITGPDGQQLRAAVEAPQQRDYQAEAFNSLVSDLIEGQRDMSGALPPTAVQTAIAQAQQVQAARQPQGGGVQTATNPKTGEKMRKNPQTGAWEPVK